MKLKSLFFFPLIRARLEEKKEKRGGLALAATERTDLRELEAVDTVVS